MYKFTGNPVRIGNRIASHAVCGRIHNPHTGEFLGGGILEWHFDLESARRCMAEMRRYPRNFSGLRIERNHMKL